jgi:hypothetical protein
MRPAVPGHWLRQTWTDTPADIEEVRLMVADSLPDHRIAVLSIDDDDMTRLPSECGDAALYGLGDVDEYPAIRCATWHGTPDHPLHLPCGDCGRKPGAVQP